MERSELAKYYMSVIKDDEKSVKLKSLKEHKKILKQRLRAIENYKQMVETQLESVLDQIDYMTIYY